MGDDRLQKEGQLRFEEGQLRWAVAESALLERGYSLGDAAPHMQVVKILKREFNFQEFKVAEPLIFLDG